MKTRKGRRTSLWMGMGVLVAGVIATLVVVLQTPRTLADEVVVYKSPSCGCCGRWVEHMRQAGFRVRVEDLADVTPTKARLGVPRRLYSCHTARVGDYLVEGHVPAEQVKRLLKERPAVAGLSVPGMPMGSPGMEGPRKDAYAVVAFTSDGSTSIYARY